MITRWKVLVLLLSVLLTACGGGGGGSATPAPPLDTVPPAVTLTAVASPTALSSQQLSGTVEPGSSVSLTLTPAGTSGEASVVGGNWTYSLAGLQAGSNTLVIVARDAAGNASAPLTTTIVLDAQAPLLTLSPPPARTSSGSAVLGGTVNETALVEVAYTGPGATLGAVSYPTATTWEVTVTGLSEGSHGFSVSGTDAVGNASARISATIIQDSLAPLVLLGQATPPAGAPAVSIWSPITFTFSEEMDPASILGATVLVADDLGPVPGIITSSDNKTFRFLGSEEGFLVPFEALSAVTVTISTAARDLTGNPLTTAVTWSFTAGANEPPPPPQ